MRTHVERTWDTVREAENEMKLLLVEDDAKISRFLLKGLREEQHVVDLAETGPAGLDQVSQADYDAVVLDLMLPGLDGFAVCRAMRSQDVASPVLILSVVILLRGARTHQRDVDLSRHGGDRRAQFV